MKFDLQFIPAITTQADFTYSITPDTISITDTGKGKVMRQKRDRSCTAQDRVLAPGINCCVQDYVSR